MTKTGLEGYRAEKERERERERRRRERGKDEKTEKEREKMAEIKGGTLFPGLLGGGSKPGLLA